MYNLQCELCSGISVSLADTFLSTADPMHIFVNEIHILADLSLYLMFYGNFRVEVILLSGNTICIHLPLHLNFTVVTHQL